MNELIATALDAVTAYRAAVADRDDVARQLAAANDRVKAAGLASDRAAEAVQKATGYADAVRDGDAYYRVSPHPVLGEKWGGLVPLVVAEIDRTTEIRGDD